MLSWGKCKNGQYHQNPAVMVNLVVPQFSRPMRLLGSLTQNFSIMVSIKISIMIETYWINFDDWQFLEFFPKCPLKWSWSYLKFKTNIFYIFIFFIFFLFTYIFYIIYFYTYFIYIFYIYILIHFLLLIIIYILFKFQMLDKKDLRIGFCLFTYSKVQGFLTDIRLLKVFLFETHNRLFSYSILCFTTKN